MTTTQWLSFDSDKDAAKHLLSWWQGLEASRGDRAELRRCRTPSEVAFCASFHRLRHMLLPFGQHSRERLATVAGVLAHVRAHVEDGRLATLMARPKDGSDRPRLSGLRFRRLLKVDDTEDLYPEMIRILRLLGGAANVVDLADTIIHWNRERKKQLAYAYYETAPKAD